MILNNTSSLCKQTFKQANPFLQNAQTLPKISSHPSFETSNLKPSRTCTKAPVQRISPLHQNKQPARRIHETCKVHSREAASPRRNLRALAAPRHSPRGGSRENRDRAPTSASARVNGAARLRVDSRARAHGDRYARPRLTFAGFFTDSRCGCEKCALDDARFFALQREPGRLTTARLSGNGRFCGGVGFLALRR